jgi:predicted membrane channel-forming protein YqfA (hemolysin III family)
MNENQIIKIWNDQKSARVKTLLTPVILFSVVLGLIGTGNLDKKSDFGLRAFVIVLIFTGVLFSVGAVLHSIREGIALTRTLEEVKGLTILGKNIRNSSPTLIFWGFTVIVAALFNFFALYILLF